MASLAKATFAFVILFFLSSRAFAFPIEPVTLRTLIDRSDVIIHGKVLEVQGNHTKEIQKLQQQLATADPRLRPLYQHMIDSRQSMGPRTGTAIAKVAVLETFKGNSAREVAIQYNAGLICPSPPRFPVSSNMVLFLKSSGRGTFETVALSYGALEVSPEGAKSLGGRIREYLEITKETDLNTRTNRTVEWLVSLVQEPQTRWDGIAELVERDSLLGKKIPARLDAKLTQEQLTSMKAAVLQSTNCTAGDREVLKLVAKDDPLSVAHHVILYLKSAEVLGEETAEGRDSFEEPWNIYDALLLLAELGNDRERFQSVMGRTLRTSFMDGAERRVALTKKLLPEAMRGVENQPWWKPLSIQSTRK